MRHDFRKALGNLIPPNLGSGMLSGQARANAEGSWRSRGLVSMRPGRTSVP